jgi:SAM-dependent methyltransferase
VRFSDADLELDDALDNLDGADNYASWILGLMEPYLGCEILEVGAGNGTFTELLAKQSDRRVVATDVSQRRVDVLSDRFCRVPNVEIVRGEVGAIARPDTFDAAVLVNVLEHIEDDNDGLRQVWWSLKPGGRLILWVPAYEALYGDFDRKVGHYRRYQLDGLKTKMSAAGFEMVQIHYANAIGAVAWWVLACVLRRTPTRRSSVVFFDRYVVPAVKYLEAKRRPPFGQSIFAVAVRPSQSLG